MKYEHYRRNTRGDAAPRTTCVVCGLSHVAGLVAVTPYQSFICEGCAQGLHAAVVAHNAAVVTRTMRSTGGDHSL